MIFRQLAKEWLQDVHAKHVTPKTSENISGEINRHLLVYIGDFDIDEITPKFLLDTLLTIAQGSPYLAKRLCQRLNAMYVYAGIMGYTDKNPAYQLDTFLPKHRPSCHAYVENKSDLSTLLKSVDKDKTTSRAVKAAFWVLVYTATRRSETCLALRNEFDLAGKTWTIPAQHTKTRNTQTVILSTQVVEILTAEFGRIDSPWAFTSPHARHGLKHIDPWSPYYMLVKLGYAGKQTMHGFRHLFSTYAHDAEFNSDAIELSLGHVIGGVKGVYNHAQMLEQRAKIMQAWADYIDDLRGAR